MALSQYTICAYDNLSYFLLLLSLLLIVRPFRFSPLLLLGAYCGHAGPRVGRVTLSFYFAYHYVRIRQWRRGNASSWPLWWWRSWERMRCCGC